MIPVYADDEGTPARDAVLIKRGMLTEFMTSRETAARLGIPPTGSARAYAPHDEPLVRMRNTAILPGTAKLDDMIAGVDDGYLLLKTGNGQADSTTEFMFGVTLAYEIRNGKPRPRHARHHDLGLGHQGAAERRRGVRRHVLELRRLLRQEAADGGLDGRAGAARARAPRRPVNGQHGRHSESSGTRRAALAQMRRAGLRARAGAASVPRAQHELNIAHNEPSLLRSTEQRTARAARASSTAARPTPSSPTSTHDAVRERIASLYADAPSAPRDDANAVSSGQHARIVQGPQAGRRGLLADKARELLDFRAPRDAEDDARRGAAPHMRVELAHC